MMIVADGVHSFSDGTSNVVGLVAIHIAGHPADEDHPYGHQKYETLAAVIVSFFLFIVSLEIIKKAVMGLIHPVRPDVSPASFLVMGFTLVVNVFVAIYERRRARELRSDFLASDSWHTLTDVFVTLSIFAALVGIEHGIPRLDAVFSLAIAGVIVAAAVNILKHSSGILTDRVALDKENVERLVRSVEGVLDCHEIRTRGRADNIYIDLHVLVEPQMTVLISHALATRIESRIRKEIPGVCDVVVHIEPLSHEHDGI